MRNIEWPAEIWYTLKALVEFLVEILGAAAKVIGLVLMATFAWLLICLLAFVARG